MREQSPHLFEKHFLRFLARKSGSLPPEIRNIIKSLTQAVISQHSCLDLLGTDPLIIQMLTDHPMIGDADDNSPIVLSNNKLYFSRFYRLERDVAALLSQRNTQLSSPTFEDLADSLNQLFGQQTGDRQKLAALLAASRGLTIITGGPGTGKTSTVVKILSLLASVEPELDVKLAAPTGKAAMRLADSIREQLSKDDSESLKVTTLHRLLGMRRDGRSWRHGPNNPLFADVLIVDEASMIDLPMMHRLLTALPAQTRLILLGDPNQLPSVETGNVLADICAGDPGFSEEMTQSASPLVGDIPLTATTHLLTNSICHLDKNYRFDATSSIGELASRVQHADPDQPQDLDGTVTFANTEDIDLARHWSDYIALLESGERNPELLLETFERTRILCSRRTGATGVEQLNQRVELELERRNFKKTDSSFYPGRPVLITENDYNLGLFNGDIGIALALKDDQYIVVFSGNFDAQYLASRLPNHETCFVMTIHKSQGSEFDHVILSLEDATTAETEGLQTRELLYTAITRAKKKVTIYCSNASWQAAIQRTSARVSGMAEFLGMSPAQSGSLHHAKQDQIPLFDE